MRQTRDDYIEPDYYDGTSDFQSPPKEWNNPKNWKLLYYRNHDKRFATIPKEKRREYPDAITTKQAERGKIVVRRRYTLEDLEGYEFGQYASDILAEIFGPFGESIIDEFGKNIYARNVPMSEVFREAEENRKWRKRFRSHVLLRV